MKRVTNSHVLELYRKEFDLIADFIVDRLKVDVRKETKSRKHNLPKYRCLFFSIALETTKADCATIGAFLGKDHATVVHAKKMWLSGLNKDLGKHLVDFKEIKGDFKEASTSDLIIKYQTKIKKLQDHILEMNLKSERQKTNIYTNITDASLKELLTLEGEHVDFFVKTRLEPFLKMNSLKRIINKVA